MDNSVPIIKGAKRRPGEKKKKVDYRKWANKHLSPGTMPAQVGGMGPGRRSWCNKCKGTPSMTTYKTDGKGYCGKCGEQVVDYMRYDYDRKRTIEELKKYKILRPFLNFYDKYYLLQRAKKDTRTSW